MPGAPPATASQYWIGLSVEPAGPKLELPGHQGLTVREVMPESPAAKAGIKAHDMILNAGDRPLKSVQDLVQAVQQAKEKDLVLELIRGRQEAEAYRETGQTARGGKCIFPTRRMLNGNTRARMAPEPTIRRFPAAVMIIVEEAETAEARPRRRRERLARNRKRPGLRPRPTSASGSNSGMNWPKRPGRRTRRCSRSARTRRARPTALGADRKPE